MINPHTKKHSASPQKIKNDLRAIYTQEDGTVPDMHRISRRNRSGFRRFLIRGIVLLCVISVLAWSGFFFFSKGLFQKNNSLSLRVEGPDEVKSGDVVTYLIRYENIGDVPIAALELSASLPRDFHVASTVPEPNGKNIWTIGSLAPKSDGVVTVRGMFEAEVPSMEKWQALATYKPANFNSSFQQIETKNIQINDSVIELAVKGPDHTTVGTVVDYVFTIGQTRSTPIGNLRVMPVLPQTFNIQSTEPAFENNQAFWNVLTLDPNQPKTFTIHGAYSASTNGDQHIGANVGFVVDDVVYKQKNAEVITSIQNEGLSFHLVVNGSNTDQTIDPGKTLKGSIDFTNQSKDSLKDVSLVLSLDATGALPIDWKKADLKNGVKSGNQISWNASSTNELSILKPNQSGTIDFSLPIQSDSKTADHFLLTLSAQASGTKTLSVTPITISVNSEMKFRAQARYFTEDGIPIGSGPLPPTVGKTTTYRVYWNITNALHDLSGIAVTTSIPANVMWINKSGTDIGTIAYKKDVITWTIPKLPTSIPEVSAWFDVSVKPTASDVDTSMSLASSSTINAKDAVTSQPIAKTTDALTTNLVMDEFASGKGTVKK